MIKYDLKKKMIILRKINSIAISKASLYSSSKLNFDYIIQVFSLLRMLSFLNFKCLIQGGNFKSAEF